MPDLAQVRRLLGLFLPALFPSWRFFETIGASPWVEVEVRGVWTPAIAVPRRMGAAGLIASLLWNPTRAEALYLVALAERVVSEPEGPAIRLLRNRIAKHHGPAPFRIWLETGAGRDLAFEHRP